MKKTALCEPQLVECEILSEEIINEKTQESILKVAVKWQQADSLNINKRIYPRSILEREINRIQKDLKAGKVFGAAYHPEKGGAEVPDVAMIWRSAKIEKDGSCTGKIDILPTRHGKDAQTIIKAGGSIGISSRGYGTTTQKTDVIGGERQSFSQVNDDFFLKTPGDIVLSPSVVDAGVREMLESHFNENADSEVLNDGSRMNKITLKTLREEAPEVLKEHEAEIKKAADAEANKQTKDETALAAERKKEIEAAVDEKIKPLQTELASFKDKQKKSTEAVAKFAADYFEVNEVATDDNDDDEETKDEKGNTDLEKKVAGLEKKNVELETKIKDREDKEKEDETNSETQKKVKDAFEKVIEKDNHKSLIEKELVNEDGIVAIDKVEDVEEAVKTAKAKVSAMLTEAKKLNIISGNVDEIGKVKDPEGEKDQAKAAGIQQRYDEAVESGYCGSIQNYKELLEKRESK